MQEAEAEFCPEEQMTGLLTTLKDSDDAGLRQLEQLLTIYPNDPRLHFLKGSVLAGLQQYEEGRLAMAQAIAIAPNFELARFQLGFLELTSGLAADAAETWLPFSELPQNAPFHLFSEGLNCLAKDDFVECDRLLRQGIKANQEHPLVNGDMQLILDEIKDKLDLQPVPDVTSSEPASAVHQLLQQFELKDSVNKTKH